MKRCIFCGEVRKRSNEHVFPKWLQAQLGIENVPMQLVRGSDKRNPYGYKSHVAGSVCEGCNNGWMSELEQLARPRLTDMFTDQGIAALCDTEVHILSLWIFKTSLTLHSAGIFTQLIPDEHYRLAHDRKAPAHCRISIARLDPYLEQPGWIQSQNWLGIERHWSGKELQEQLKRTYRVVFGFGHFAARVTYFPLSVPLFPLEDGVQFLHPYRTTIVWPPHASIDNLWELDNGLVVSAGLSNVDLRHDG